MTEPVALESIQAAFRGVIPSALATCAADGTPNVSYMSVVHYVDSDRVALSRQFFNKTRANLDVNPRCQVLVVDPETFQEYLLDLEYVRTETHGPTFEAMNANTEAIAAAAGMSSVFRLRGVDIHRVLRCVHVARTGLARSPAVARNVLGQLDELTRRLALCTDYDGATRTALQSLDDLFGFRQSILLVREREPASERLLAVAGHGYDSPAEGAELPLGQGVIGVAAETRHVVTVPNVARSRVMQAAIASRNAGGSGAEIPLPSLAAAESVAAVPLLAGGEANGVLYLESADPGAFGAHNERLLRIVGAHLASMLRALDPATGTDVGDQAELPPRAVAPTRARKPISVTYHQADDSVFVGDRYVVKGVPGRILWKLLCDHATHGRESFTNRELRLDEQLGLPPHNDNLEARLLVLRRRLSGGSYGIGLERTGRGRLLLSVGQPLELVEVPTSGPMRAAHVLGERADAEAEYLVTGPERGDVPTYRLDGSGDVISEDRVLRSGEPEAQQPDDVRLASDDRRVIPVGRGGADAYEYLVVRRYRLVDLPEIEDIVGWPVSVVNDGLHRRPLRRCSSAASRFLSFAARAIGGTFGPSRSTTDVREPEPL